MTALVVGLSGAGRGEAVTGNTPLAGGGAEGCIFVPRVRLCFEQLRPQCLLTHHSAPSCARWGGGGGTSPSWLLTRLRSCPWEGAQLRPCPGPVAHVAGPACGGGSWGLWWQSIELLQASRSPGAFREEIAGGIEDKKVSAKGRLQGPWEPLSPGNKGPQ